MIMKTYRCRDTGHLFSALIISVQEKARRQSPKNARTDTFARDINAPTIERKIQPYQKYTTTTLLNVSIQLVYVILKETIN